MSRVLRSGLVALALLLSLLVVPALAGAAPPSTGTPPPTLTGEILSGTKVNTTTDYNAFACNDPNGNIGGLTSLGGTFQFTTTGIATGPYTGPFTETGQVVINDDGTLASFTATYTIDSPIGMVSGTKTLTSGTGQCIRGVTVDANAVTTYQATITTAEGFAYTDAGTSNVFVRIGVPTTQTTTLNETFVSTQPATTPVPPTSTDQCKDGGYAGFIDPSTGAPFKNQGQCIQFVNTGK